MPPIDDSVVVQIHSPGSGHGSENASLFTVSSAVKNIAFGSFAGMVSEIFEYPFDLAKVRLQSQLLSSAGSAQLRFNGPLDCLKQTWKQEGLRGLYRGLPAPIVGSMAETAALFVAYSSLQDVIRASSSRPRSDKLSIPELALAAAGAGFFTSFFLTPIELVKCKMQVQMMNIPSQQRTPYRPLSASLSPLRLLPVPALSTSHSSILHFTPNVQTDFDRRLNSSRIASTRKQLPGLFSIIRSTVQMHGLRGLWVGHTGTMVRETGGTSAWFAVKEIVADALQRRRTAETSFSYELDDYESRSSRAPAAEDGDNLRPWESALAGAVAGGACVMAFYPADTIKSAMQTADDMRPAERGSLHSTAAKASTRTFGGTLARMYAMHGLRGLYAGCGMTVARAVPSSGIVFVVYDGLATWLG